MSDIEKLIHKLCLNGGDREKKKKKKKNNKTIKL